MIWFRDHQSAMWQVMLLLVPRRVLGMKPPDKKLAAPAKPAFCVRQHLRACLQKQSRARLRVAEQLTHASFPADVATKQHRPLSA